MSNKDRDHTKCRKLGTSDLCVCCPFGCDTPMDAPNYYELHGPPTEQKEEWLEEWDKYSNGEIVDPVPFFRTQIALAEERGQKNMADELLQIVIEDVPHQYQARILSTLTQKS